MIQSMYLSPSNEFSAARPALLQAISAETHRVLPRLVALRQHLHAHPELSGEEYRTADCVAELLAELGLEVKAGSDAPGWSVC